MVYLPKTRLATKPDYIIRTPDKCQETYCGSFAEVKAKTCEPLITDVTDCESFKGYYTASVRGIFHFFMVDNNYENFRVDTSGNSYKYEDLKNGLNTDGHQYRYYKDKVNLLPTNELCFWVAHFPPFTTGGSVGKKAADASGRGTFVWEKSDGGGPKALRMLEIGYPKNCRHSFTSHDHHYEYAADVKTGAAHFIVGGFGAKLYGRIHNFSSFRNKYKGTLGEIPYYVESKHYHNDFHYLVLRALLEDHTKCQGADLTGCKIKDNKFILEAVMIDKKGKKPVEVEHRYTCDRGSCTDSLDTTFAMLYGIDQTRGVIKSKVNPTTEGCEDIQPDTNTCADKAAWGQCSESWMIEKGWCKKTCGRC